MELMDCVFLDCEGGPCGQICCKCRNFTNLCGDHFLGRRNSRYATEPLCTFCDTKERERGQCMIIEHEIKKSQ